ncbi:MAG: methylated-DNA--[protein]-cysteine S-methyltransferase [Holosporaceae bacterium]|jgi:methylated-DNA-[protein]-cysteine S-methyltransferase|nr:methylated-DNA--[protein]-cysteine S-methyltransferase [Holosporaceae bacterium]
MDYFCCQTILGAITILADKNSVLRLSFGNHFLTNAQNIESPLIRGAFIQLMEYLNGARQIFDLDFAFDGSLFQISVWNELKKISYGKTKSYQEISIVINNPKSCRAVGKACGQNPIPIFIPCHRVIGSDGNLTGYAGGIDIKKKLLEIERKVLNAAKSSF